MTLGGQPLGGLLPIVGFFSTSCCLLQRPSRTNVSEKSCFDQATRVLVVRQSVFLKQSCSHSLSVFSPSPSLL